MKVLAVGNKRRFDELALILPVTIEAVHLDSWGKMDMNDFEIIFDLNFDDAPENLSWFGHLRKPVFCSAVKKRLSEAVFGYSRDVHSQIVGINVIPTFITREVTELSRCNTTSADIAGLAATLGFKYRIVEDRAGMVSPRMVCMIINEACYTLQEGTASISDIDLAMKLGTNYPWGPFEWADRIGIRDVYEILAAIYDDTRDERYKICPLLKTKYLKRERFYKI